MAKSDTQGFTLIEVLMTVVILGILASVAMRSMQNSIDESRVRDTQSEMDRLVYAIAGDPSLNSNGKRTDFGYVGDVGAVPSSLDDLISNPGGYSTWRGPYVQGQFAEDANGFKRDAWGNPYTFADGITISSTGGGAMPMTKSAASTAADLVNNTVVGTVKDAGGNPPGDSNVAITISITYPDGAGGTTTSTTSPGTSGTFSLTGIPVGTRLVTATYRATGDSAASYVAVLPGAGGICTLRLPGAPFASTGGGAGGGSGQIEFVPNSSSSPSNNVWLSIWNTGTDAITISSLTATYSTTAYYRYVRWNGTTVFNSSNPRAGSGDNVAFSADQTISPGQVIDLRLEDFKTNVTGGSNVQMNNVIITIEFSNGQTLAFNSA